MEDMTGAVLDAAPVIVSAEHIPDDKWIALQQHCKKQELHLSEWLEQEYDAKWVHVQDGEWVKFKFKRDKYVEFCLRWL